MSTWVCSEIEIAQDLRGLLEKSQRGFPDRSVVWPGESLIELASVLVEFGEDLLADAGLWRSLESYRNRYPLLSLVQGGES
jgi:hypothetical protein